MGTHSFPSPRFPRLLCQTKPQIAPNMIHTLKTTSNRRIPIIQFVLISTHTEGTRFRPLTFNALKPLTPLGGQPVIQHPFSAYKSKVSFFINISKGWIQSTYCVGFSKLVSMRKVLYATSLLI